MNKPGPATEQSQRLDKWLWFARFARGREDVVALIEAGRIRRNGQPASKPGQAVRLGDVLTFVQGKEVRVVRVLGFAERRGPAEAARLLYEDVATPP